MEGNRNDHTSDTQGQKLLRGYYESRRCQSNQGGRKDLRKHGKREVRVAGSKCDQGGWQSTKLLYSVLGNYSDSTPIVAVDEKKRPDLEIANIFQTLAHGD